MREAFYKPCTYGINGRYEHNWHGIRRLQQWSRGCTAGCNNNIRLSSEQFVNMLADVGGVRSGAVNS